MLENIGQAPPDKGAQDAATQISLHLGHGSLIDSTGRVEDDARRCGFGAGLIFALHHLKHPVNYADVTTKLQCRLTCTQVTS